MCDSMLFRFAGVFGSRHSYHGCVIDLDILGLRKQSPIKRQLLICAIPIDIACISVLAGGPGGILSFLRH